MMQRELTRIYWWGIGVVLTWALLVVAGCASQALAQLTPIPPIPSSPNCQMVWIVVNGQGQWVQVCR
jgi:hypothetical protein